MRRTALLGCALGALAASWELAGCGGKAGAPVRVEPSPGAPGAAAQAEKKPFAVFVTSQGRFTARLLPESAPKTVANFIDLATGRKEWTDPATGRTTQRPLYDGTVIHRVIPDFMIQGGDPTGGGRGGPGYELAEEASPEHPFSRPGLLGMARSGAGVHGSQFFITTAPAPWLAGRHAAFGEVVEGLEVADAISRLPRSSDGSDRPLEPIVVREVRIEYR